MIRTILQMIDWVNPMSAPPLGEKSADRNTFFIKTLSIV